MTATIHRIPNYAHEGAVLAERHRRDAMDPLWKFRVLKRQEGVARVAGMVG